MKIAISSDKGGTGRTFIATNLALLAAERGGAVTYLDCDIETPNAHLLLKPTIDHCTAVLCRTRMTTTRFISRGRFVTCELCDVEE